MFSEKGYDRAAEPSPNTWLGRPINEGKEKHVEPDAEKEGVEKADQKGDEKKLRTSRSLPPKTKSQSD